MLKGMLFQDFVPAYLTDGKPYCNVFSCVIKTPPLHAFLYHIDEDLTKFEIN